MHRRWQWIVGLVTAFAVGAVLTTVLSSDPAPFEFLQGQVAGAPPDYEIHVRHGVRKMQTLSSYYSFKGDYGAVVRKARSELLRDGYDEHPGQNSEAFFQRSDSKLSRTMVQQVIIRGGRYAPGPLYAAKAVLLGEEIPGWVTVFVYGPPDPSPLERFVGWLGL